MKFWLVLLIGLPQVCLAKAAIAFSKNPDETWIVFVDFNRGLTSVAEDNAVSGCKAKGGLKCSVVKTASNGCHSIAITNEGQYGLGAGNSQKVAQSRSVAACLSLAPEGSCIVRKSFCDNTGGFVQNDADPIPLSRGSTPFYCRSPDDYNKCMSGAQGPPSQGGPTERERYCRMAFC